MKKDKTILIIILLALGIFLLYHFGLFNLFTLSPITIDPSTCSNPSILSEKSILSSEVSNPCYPYSSRYPTILVSYNGKTGSYINTLSGDQLIWGNPNGISTLVRCYKCDSAQIISGPQTTHVLTDDIISNPLGQSNACSSVCVVGQCSGGWECKGNSECNYLEYTSCNNAPATPSRFCGNNILESGETNENCCKDAGCPSGYECKSNSCTLVQQQTFCGNGVCDYGETNSNCAVDCPSNGPYCGDGICGNTETQSNCCSDCKCPASQQCINNVCEQVSNSCGNKICDQQETCDSCQIEVINLN